MTAKDFAELEDKALHFSNRKTRKLSLQVLKCLRNCVEEQPF